MTREAEVMTRTLARRTQSGRRVLAVLAVCSALATGLGGCSHSVLPKPPVGLSDCYESLPLAEGALNVPKTGYTFKGVKLVSPKVMEKLIKRRYPKTVPAHLNVSATTKVCAFAFTGKFSAGQVAGAQTNEAGQAAIVLTTTSRRLLFSFVIAKLPENFARTVSA